VVILGFVMKIGKLNFGFWENLDLLDLGREFKLQPLESAAFLRCLLKLIMIPRVIKTLEAFCFSESGVEMIAFKL
jgi:hypothetical protein